MTVISAHSLRFGWLWKKKKPTDPPHQPPGGIASSSPADTSSITARSQSDSSREALMKDLSSAGFEGVSEIADKLVAMGFEDATRTQDPRRLLQLLSYPLPVASEYTPTEEKRKNPLHHFVEDYREPYFEKAPLYNYVEKRFTDLVHQASPEMIQNISNMLLDEPAKSHYKPSNQSIYIYILSRTLGIPEEALLKFKDKPGFFPSYEGEIKYSQYYKIFRALTEANYFDPGKPKNLQKMADLFNLPQAQNPLYQKNPAYEWYAGEAEFHRIDYLFGEIMKLFLEMVRSSSLPQEEIQAFYDQNPEFEMFSREETVEYRRALLYRRVKLN